MRKTLISRTRSPSWQKKRCGLFVTFEGIEGSGKSTQCQRLTATLVSKGYSVLETREPGGTPCAEKIRSLLLDHAPKAGISEVLTAECETSLVLAARSQHVTHQILPALLKGQVVLCDRFSDSTLAYQGFGRKLDIETIREFNNFVTQGLDPDLTFLFDLPIKQGLARRRRAKNQNRMDRESQAFHSRVRQGFLKLASQYPKRFVVINAQESPDSLAKLIETNLSPCYERENSRRKGFNPRTPSADPENGHGISRYYRSFAPHCMVAQCDSIRSFSPRLFICWRQRYW